MGKYFTVTELCHSNTATLRGIDNNPPLEALQALEALIDNLLDKVREDWGGPIRVNSGYRSQALNKLVGGAARSQHTTGHAADLTTGSKESNRKLFNLIRDNFDFDQLIDEKNYSWVHVSYVSPESNRKQTLKL